MTTDDALPHWIGGHDHHGAGDRRGNVFNPATGAVVRQVRFADAAEVDAAVKAAKDALPAWREATPLRRSRILQAYLELLRRNERELAAVASQEHGKTLDDALGSVRRGIEVLEFACGIPHLLKGEHAANVGSGVDAYTLRQPVGVCVGITPFNFPAMVPMWMFPVAIACGNTFVLKPSEKVPSCSLMLARLASEAGLPDGVLNVVHGDRAAVDALLTHPDVAAVSFVGSTPVARRIYETCAHNGKRVQALGGAKNHAVVMPDADLDFTTEALIGAAFGSAGERCMAISVAVAVGDVGDALVERLAARARTLTTGPGDAPGVEMGPLVTAEHRDRVRGYIDAGEREGAALVVDGRTVEVPGHGGGFFVGPTLFDRVDRSMTIYRDEIFGPVLSVVRVPTPEAAIALVNESAFANGTAIFTQSGAAARLFEETVEVGMVGINVPIPVPMAFFSFGGWKGSLFGDLHVHGTEGIKFYTRTKAVTARWRLPRVAAPALVMPTLG
ncbi:CoA-acylating methylmalonate-semialdehyde dehydrogenase [Azospirillum sp. ST 5-10]|uniref:CoA-acylating methylmalonate-semialdehyde dehydrogenase n=1 Tax=unclassified Azospirillum TaxID=2630922 RepID=UPI003F49E4A5